MLRENKKEKTTQQLGAAEDWLVKRFVTVNGIDVTFNLETGMQNCTRKHRIEKEFDKAHLK